MRKRVLEAGTGIRVQRGDEVEVEYVGTIADKDWRVEDVIECWLEAQQGMEIYADAFAKNLVDGHKLLSGDVFDEQYVTDVLGVTNRLHAKKLASAARKLQSSESEQPTGTEFDSGTMKVRLGAGKVIKGWEVGLAAMAQGERAEMIMRADVCYGKDGFRRRTGEVVVAPFASLKFVVKVLP